jgi:RecA/RadA recombinase
MSLLEKLKAAGSIKAETVSESAFFEPKDICPTSVPIINVALTGALDGGVHSGLISVCGPSRHYKSNLSLIMIKAYMSKYKDAVCLFYDSEFGTSIDYLKSHGIDTDRMIHLPIIHIENLKFDLVKKLEEIKKSDKVIIFVDSVGNLASKKEVDDAEKESSSQDMTRAKSLKSFYRIITPHLTIKDIPCIVVQHSYDTQEMYSKQVMSGGTGGMLSSNVVLMLGRSQEKDGTELVGYNFTINIEKSRYVREKSKMTFTVKFNGGISTYSGLLDLALESGHVKKPSNGWYSKVDVTTGEIEDKKYREADTNNKEFWTSILSDKTYHEFVKRKYQLAKPEYEEESE